MDDLDRMLDSPFYEENHSPRALWKALLPHSLNRVKVSRYYMKLSPPVVVDFEPTRSPIPFLHAEKQRWFAQKGVVYVAVFRNDRLSAAEFTKRLREAKGQMDQLRAENHAREALVAAAVADSPLVDQAAREELDRRALELLEREIADNPNLRGASRAKRLALIRRQLGTVESLGAKTTPPVAGQSTPAKESSR